MKRQKFLVAVVLALVFLAMAPAFAQKEDGRKWNWGKKREPAVRVDRPGKMNEVSPRENARPPKEDIRVERGKFPRGNEGKAIERPPWGKASSEQKSKSVQEGERGFGPWKTSGKNQPSETRGQGRETRRFSGTTPFHPGPIKTNPQPLPGWGHPRPVPGPRHPIPSGPTVDHRRVQSGKIPGARVIDRSSIRQLRPAYSRVVHQFGRPPSHRYAFEPRRVYARGFRHPHFRGRVALSFYFGYYYSEPEWVGLYHHGYYPAVYALWGWCPGWLLPARIHYIVFDYIDREPAPRDYEGVDQAVADIQDAWLDGDIQLITNRLTDDVRVRIYFNGKYSYSLAIEDFRQMTADALVSTKTTAIRFNPPVWLAPREVFVRGHQLFLDPEGGEHQMYLFYRLRHLGDGWYIVAFGSSDEPIVSPYRR